MSPQVIEFGNCEHAPALLFGVSRLSWLEFSFAISVIGVCAEVVEVVGMSVWAGCVVCSVRYAAQNIMGSYTPNKLSNPRTSEPYLGP